MDGGDRGQGSGYGGQGRKYGAKMRLLDGADSGKLRRRKLGLILPSRKQTVVQRLLHFTRRVSCMAALLLPLLAASGCALMNKETWNLNNYRDDRAVDIDTRLEKTGPNVPNPF